MCVLRIISRKGCKCHKVMSNCIEMCMYMYLTAACPMSCIPCIVHICSSTSTFMTARILPPMLMFMILHAFVNAIPLAYSLSPYSPISLFLTSLFSGSWPLQCSVNQAPRHDRALALPVTFCTRFPFPRSWCSIWSRFSIFSLLTGQNSGRFWVVFTIFTSYLYYTDAL